MDIGSVIIMAAVVVWFVLAVRSMIRSNTGGCGSCSGCVYRNNCKKAK